VFSYVDKTIRERLINEGKLVTINSRGEIAKDSDNDDPIISILGPIPMPVTINGKKVIFSWFPFVRRVQLSNVLEAGEKVDDGSSESFRELLQTNMSVNSLLTSPDFLNVPEPLVRVHSCCMTGDVFGSLRCECGPQLDYAFEQAAEKGGAVIYMSGHEGRGIGLWAKAVTYILQDEGQDTYEANISLGLPEDSRDFSDAAVVLRYMLKGKAVRLLSNNPLKEEHLVEAGQPVSEVIPFVTGVSDHNIRYLQSKRSKGHLLPDLEK